MKMAWSVGPRPQRVRLELSITGREQVWVDGMPVSRKMNWGARSEHDVPLIGRTAKLIVQSNGMTARGELFVDGVREEPDWRPVEPERPLSHAPFDTRTPLERAGSMGITLVATALGALLGGNLGFALLFPLGFCLFTSFIGWRLAPERSRPLVPAVGLLGGHVGWMATGVVVAAQLHTRFPDNYLEWLFVEIALFSLLGIVLLASAAPWAILITGVLELGAIASNLMSLGMIGADDTVVHKGLSGALLLRAGIVVLLFLGWKKLSGPGPGPALATEPLSAHRSPAVGEWTNCGQCGLEHRVSPSLRCPRCDVAYAGSRP